MSLLRQSGQASRLLIAFLISTLLIAMLAAAPGVASSLDAAEQDWANGNLKSAIIRLKTVLQDDPGDADARLLLGRVFIDAGEPEAAEQQLAHARAAGVPDNELLQPLADALLAQGKNGEVLKLTEDQVDAPPALRSVLLTLRGEALLNQNLFEEAERAFRQAADFDSVSARPMIGLASIALRAGDVGEARRLLMIARSVEPDSAPAWEALGSLEYQLGRSTEAVEAFSSALEQAPGRWQSRYRRALAYVDLGDAAGAAQDIAVVREVSPTLPGIAFVEGWLQLAAGDPVEAVRKLEAFLRTAPNDMRGVYFAAIALGQAGRYAQSEEYLVRFLAKVPNSQPAAILLAEIKLQRGDVSGAKSIIEPIASAVDAQPNAVELLHRVLLMQGRRQDAAKLIEDAAERFPKLPAVRIELAKQMQEAGKLDESAALLREILAEMPANERARQMLLRAEILSGDQVAALRSADAFLEQSPNSPLAHTARGALLALGGDLDSARAALKQALEIDPSFTRAAIMLTSIELGQQDSETARTTLEELVEADPDNLAGNLLLGRMETKSGETDAVAARLRSALDSNPNSLPLRMALAGHLADAQSPEAALDLINKAPVDQRDQPRLLLLRARAEVATGLNAHAASTLARLADLQPESPQVFFLLASVNAAQGRYGVAEDRLAQALALDERFMLKADGVKAILEQFPAGTDRKAALERLLSAVPEHPALIVAKAQVLRELGDTTAAVGMLKQLYWDFPDDQGYMTGITKALVAAGRRSDAAEVLEDWIERHPDSEMPRMLLGELRLAENEHDAAIEQYQAVIALNPDNALALNNLAMLLINMAPSDALNFAQRAMKLRPDQPAIIDTVAKALVATGSPTEARDLLARAHADLSDPTVSFLYAKSLAAAGDRATARRLLMEIQFKSFPTRREADALFHELERAP